MVELSFDGHPSQELGSADSSLLEDLDYLLDPPRGTIPWQQDRTASPELFGDAIDLDDNLLLDSHRWSQVPTTQIVRMFEQSWKEPSFQDFGADNSSQAFICYSPRYTFPWQQDWIASPEFFGSSISSDANSQPYLSKEEGVLFIPPPKKSVKLMMIWAVLRSEFLRLHKKPIVEVEERIAQSPLFSKELTLQITQLAICSPPPITLPNGGDTVQLDSSEQQSLVEFDATNNGHVVSQDHSSSTGSHSKKKNTDHLKNNTKETLEIQCRNKIKLSLEDIKQQFVNKREDAAKNLGVSVPTLKRTCRKYRINRWPYCKENKGSYKGMGVRSGRGTSSSAQAACSTKRFAPVVPASSSRKRIRSSSQIATPGNTSADDAMAKSTDPVIHEIDEHGDDGRTPHQLIHWSEPLRMLPLKREKYSGFRKSQTSIVDRESKFTDFGEQAREVEGNKGESAGGEDGVEEEEDNVESELSRGNSRVREELEEDRDEVQCCEHVEVEMLSVELAENVIDLPANQPSVHPVDIPSLAKEDATPSKPVLL